MRLCEITVVNASPVRVCVPFSFVCSARRQQRYPPPVLLPYRKPVILLTVRDSPLARYYWPCHMATNGGYHHGGFREVIVLEKKTNVSRPGKHRSVSQQPTNWVFQSLVCIPFSWFFRLSTLLVSCQPVDRKTCFKFSILWSNSCS